MLNEKVQALTMTQFNGALGGFSALRYIRLESVRAATKRTNTATRCSMRIRHKRSHGGFHLPTISQENQTMREAGWLQQHLQLQPHPPLWRVGPASPAAAAAAAAAAIAASAAAQRRQCQ